MINRKHTGIYYQNMRPDKVEYSTSAGPYCTTHDVKVPFFIPYFPISKIIPHRFNVVNDESGFIIVYNMVI